MGRKILLSCEHASNQVPPHLTAFFHGAQIALKTHRGYDLGALELCQELAEKWGSPYVYYGQWSRLVVDLNRSEHHPKFFSQWTEGLNPVEKEYLLDSVYRPFRRQVLEAIQGILASGDSVLHLSIHSFTPVLDGEVRNNDLGLLYDPTRKAEQQLAMQWGKNLEHKGHLKVRRNYPYRGIADGHVTDLRKRFQNGYWGYEIEWNQALLETHAPQTLAELLVETLPEPPKGAIAC